MSVCVLGHATMSVCVLGHAAISVCVPGHAAISVFVLGHATISVCVIGHATMSVCVLGHAVMSVCVLGHATVSVCVLGHRTGRGGSGQGGSGCPGPITAGTNQGHGSCNVGSYVSERSLLADSGGSTCFHVYVCMLFRSERRFAMCNVGSTGLPSGCQGMGGPEG